MYIFGMRSVLLSSHSWFGWGIVERDVQICTLALIYATKRVELSAFFSDLCTVICHRFPGLTTGISRLAAYHW